MTNRVDLHDKKLEDMDQDEYDHVNKQISQKLDIANELALKSAEAANTTEQNMSAQLILISTVIFTGSLLGISNSELLKQLTEFDKSLLLIICILQVVSIISGIKNYRAIEKFMGDIATNQNKKARIIAHKEYATYSELNKKLKKHDKENSPPEMSPRLYTNMQVFSIAASLALFCCLLFTILFNIQLNTEAMSKMIEFNHHN